MNTIKLSLLFFLAIGFFTSCNDDDEPMETEFEYHAHIHSPNTDDKHVDNTINIDIDFESHTGQPVHHVNIRIINKADNSVVYNQPGEAHVHATSGSFEYEDSFVLSNANGVTEHTDWILEAKVWGDGEGVGLVTETVEFHVHP